MSGRDLGRDIFRESYLSSICSEGNVELVQQFINASKNTAMKRANYTYQDNHKFTPLHHAICSKNGELIKMLLNLKTIDVKAENVEGETALFLACKTNGIDTFVIQLLVDYDKTLVEYVNNENVSPLQRAIISGRLDLVQILVNAGSPINYQDLDGETALIYSIRYAKIDIFKYLLQVNGVDPTMRNFKHHNPLILAVMKMIQHNFTSSLLIDFFDVGVHPRDSIIMEQIKGLIEFTIHLDDYGNAEQTNDVLICFACVYLSKLDKYIDFLINNLMVKWTNSIDPERNNLTRVLFKFIDKLESNSLGNKARRSIYFMVMLLELTNAHTITKAVNYNPLMEFIGILNTKDGVKITISYLINFYRLMIMESIDQKDLFYEVCHKIYTNNDRKCFSLSGLHSIEAAAPHYFFARIFQEVEDINGTLNKEQFLNLIYALTHYGIDINEIFFSHDAWKIYNSGGILNAHKFVPLYLPLINDQPFKSNTVSLIGCRTPFEFYEKHFVQNLNKDKGVWSLTHVCARLVRQLIFYKKNLTFQERRLLASKLTLPNSCTDRLFMNFNHLKIYDHRCLELARKTLRQESII